MTDDASTPLLEPRDGLPDVITDADTAKATIAAFAAADGPVAVDAERASGYRYGHRAYLIQLRRNGAGTALIDPIAVPDLSALGAALADTEWVLHAASQDLACLAEVGMKPERLFDTELAGRLLGLPRVGLGPLVDSVLGYALEKGHSAADWSTRPLPEDWLRYAALDVELLIELRDALEERLISTGKLDWAHEEFAAIAAAPQQEPRADPWRRTSGMHRVRDRRRLAVVRQLWYARDDLARQRDLSPGRVLPDAAIVEAALTMPTSAEAMSAMPVYRGRSQRRELSRWFGAVADARALPDKELPPQTAPYDGPPPPRAWAARQPDAAARLAAARARVTAIAEAHDLPVENLLTPDTLRRAAWQPPAPLTADAVADLFRGRGARDWQIGLTAAAVAEAFANPEPPEPAPAPAAPPAESA
ncbi:ribonuclease D [Jiangella muralis]|uniref:ribonuclease D n=1 Tax=Jiangella muralis TaxID=702383 RepID=UPI00069D28AD|nr:ribonuclease D [Jiangella muralis]